MIIFINIHQNCLEEACFLCASPAKQGEAQEAGEKTKCYLPEGELEACGQR
jgi:hypothetical protein